MLIRFTATVGDNDVTVNAEYTPGEPEHPPTHESGGEPATGPEVQILDVFLGEGEGHYFEIDGLYVRERHDPDFNRRQNPVKHISVEDKLLDAAIQHVEEGCES